MALLDVSIVNVALDSIRIGLDASSSQLQWIVSGYALSYGLVLVPAGRVGDARGRRRVFVAGVGLFTLSSLAAALAPSAAWLVVARLAQGVGGGLLSPQMSAIIQDLFRGAERGRAFGLLGSTIGISTAVGPIAGGVILGALGSESGWRWIFVINLPIGLAAIALSFRYLPAWRPEPSPESRDLDPAGVLLLGAALSALLLPLVQRNWEPGVRLLLVAIGLVLFVALVLWERRYAARGHVPVVDLSLFGYRSYRHGALVGTTYFSGFTGVLFVLALYLQAGLGYSPLETGLALTSFALASALGSMLGGRVITRIGRPVVVLGLLLVMLGLAATDVLVGHAPVGIPLGWALAAPLALAGLGTGLTISPNITLTLSEVPVPRAGTAGGIMQTGQRLGTAAGIALVGAVLFGTLDGSDWTTAAQAGLRTAIGLSAVALLVALHDQFTGLPAPDAASARARAD